MIYLLLKWPDVSTAVECGKLIGTTSDDSGDNVTASYTNGLNLSVIGSHSYITDEGDPMADPPVPPTIVTVPGHWVMAWCRNDYPLDAALSQIPVNLQPDVVWRSDAVDDDGNPIPRPPINIAPQHRVA